MSNGRISQLCNVIIGRGVYFKIEMQMQGTGTQPVSVVGEMTFTSCIGLASTLHGITKFCC